MTLEEKIADDLKAAIEAKDTTRTSCHETPSFCEGVFFLK